MEQFVEWLQAELDQRGWLASDLARRAGLGSGTLSQLMNGYRNPGPDVCRSIAHALKVPEEEVFRRAGLLSPKPELSDQAEELRSIIGLLKEENVAYVAEIARWRLNQQAQEDNQPDAEAAEKKKLLEALEKLSPAEREAAIKNQTARSRLQQANRKRTPKGSAGDTR